MLASSPTMSASGTDHISGTNAKMSRPSPGPTEWLSVSVVYGPPDVEKKRTKTSPSVPIARGSFCLIDHVSTTKRTKRLHSKCLRKSGTQETLFDSQAKSWERFCFVSLIAQALRCYRDQISVTLCPL